MVTVTIGDMVRSFETRTSIDESWVNQQIQARKRPGTEPCIKVQIRMRDLELTLVSAACNCGGGGGSLTPAQQALADMWRELGLWNASISGGNLIAFLKRVFGHSH